MLSKSDYRYFEKAHQAALISDFNKTHVGCIAVYQGNIIAIGCNTHKTHPRQQYYNQFRTIRYSDSKYLPKMHAEIHCLNVIRNLDINFAKVKLYVYRTRKEMCIRDSYYVDKVEYSKSDLAVYATKTQIF